MTGRRQIQKITAAVLGLAIFFMVATTVYILVKDSRDGARQASGVSSEKVREMNLASNREGSWKDVPGSEGVLITAMPEVMTFSEVVEEEVEEAEEAQPETQQGPAAQADFYFPNSDTALITDEEIASLSAEQAQMAINEILARKGRRFQDPQIQAYFDSQSWYAGTVAPEVFDANRASYLNEIEISNINRLAAHR